MRTKIYEVEGGNRRYTLWQDDNPPFGTVYQIAVHCGRAPGFRKLQPKYAHKLRLANGGVIEGWRTEAAAREAMDNAAKTRTPYKNRRFI